MAYVPPHRRSAGPSADLRPSTRPSGPPGQPGVWPQDYKPQQSPRQPGPWSSAARSQDAARLLHVFGDSFVGPFTLCVCLELIALIMQVSRRQAGPRAQVQGRERAWPRQLELDAASRPAGAGHLVAAARGSSSPDAVRTGPVSIALTAQLRRRRPRCQPRSSWDHADALIGQLYALETGSLDASAEPEVFADRVADAYFAFLLSSVFEIARSLRLRIGLSTIIAPIVADDALSRVLTKYTRESERDNSATSAREDALLPATARERDPMLGMSAREDAAVAWTGGPTHFANRIDDLLARNPSPCSMVSRRRMVRHFNSRLADFCRANPSFRLVDINDGAVDSQSGAVLPEFICRDPVNIHPLYEPSAPAWLDDRADHRSAPAMGQRASQRRLRAGGALARGAAAGRVVRRSRGLSRGQGAAPLWPRGRASHLSCTHLMHRLSPALDLDVVLDRCAPSSSRVRGGGCGAPSFMLSSLRISAPFCM